MKVAGRDEWIILMAKNMPNQQLLATLAHTSCAVGDHNRE
jgi:hypothetical protein